jgi:hypothetical protein
MPNAIQNPSDRAFLRAIAGADATSVSTAQIRDFADGLCGRPKDGVVDAIEARALTFIASDALVSRGLLNQLDGALEQHDFRIPIAASTPGALRVPTYIDLTTLESVERRRDGVTFSDANGNQMLMLPDDASPTGFAVAFARRGATLDGAPSIKLNAAEADAIDLAVMRRAFAKARESLDLTPADANKVGRGLFRRYGTELNVISNIWAGSGAND